MSVSVLDIDPEGERKLNVDRDREIHYEICDITDSTQVNTGVEKVFQKQGSIDVLLNNAGILYSEPLIKFSGGKLQKHDLAGWEKTIAINLTGAFLVAREVVEKMVMKRTKGVIVNVSSISAGGNPGQSAYSASKAGLNALTATWAKEFSMLGIRVVGIAPGFTDTPSTHAAVNEAIIKDVRKRTPLGRLGTPEEIEEGVLAVIQNDFFNGKVFELDGGLVI